MSPVAARLIVNADDFGFTRDVNRGVIDAYERGILRSTTLMAGGDAFDDAVALAAGAPGLDVGVHLVVVGGRSVAEPGRALPATLSELVWRIARGWSVAAIEEEMAAQIEKIQAAGLAPSHLDVHKHAHLLPTVLEAVVRVAVRYRIGWIRKPFDIPLTAAAGSAPATRRWLHRSFGPLRAGFDRRIAARGLRAADHFAGFQITGLFREQELATLIRALPDGVTELMCHPGYCTDELRAARTRLKESRERELEALVSHAAAEAVAERGVTLSGFAPAAPATAR